MNYLRAKFGDFVLSCFMVLWCGQTDRQNYRGGYDRYTHATTVITDRYGITTVVFLTAKQSIEGLAMRYTHTTVILNRRRRL